LWSETCSFDKQKYDCPTSKQRELEIRFSALESLRYLAVWLSDL